MENQSVPLNNFEHLRERCGKALPQLEVALDRAERWMGECASLINGMSFLTTNRLRVAIALQHLSMEHHQGVYVLISQGVVGSAFALLRPQFETYVRGAWFHSCASVEHIEAFLKGADPPRLDKLIEDLEKIEAFGCGSLGDLKRTAYRNFCDFTHGGAIQVKARNSRDEIISNYIPNDVINILEASTILSFHAAVAIATVADDATLTNLLLKKYQEIHREG